MSQRKRSEPPRRDREADRRRKGRADRTRQESADFDPAPPTDGDWTIGVGSGLRRLRRPEPVGDALTDFLARTGWADRARATRLLASWPQIVGAEIAAHTRPRRIERGTLILVADSSTWATQLTWLESTLVEKVNEAAGERLISRVRVEVGDVNVGDG